MREPPAPVQIDHDLRVGTAAWAIARAFASRFGAAGSTLERYAAKFNAVEINSTFKRSHKPQTFRRWAAAVPAYFRFSVKLPKLITHENKLVNVEAPLDEFLECVTELGAKLGPLLVQLPPSLTFNVDLANQFFSALRVKFSGDIACEPRHAGWFEKEADQLLTRHRVARVAADPSISAKASLPGGYCKLAYFRLHGAPRVYYSAYGAAYMEALRDRLNSAGEQSWCIFDNTAAGAATEDALLLKDLLAAR